MSIEYFRVYQDGTERGRGMIDRGNGEGYLQLSGIVYRIKEKRQGDSWGNYERLPGPGSNQPPVSE